MTMDSLPPNDPNRNDGNNPRPSAAKEAPYDGRRRQQNGTDENGTMDVFGNMEDSPIVVMMFLVGVATWFLRERCMC